VDEVDAIRTAIDDIAHIADPIQRAKTASEAFKTCRGALAELAEMRRTAIADLRQQGLSYREIGRALGISFARVRQIEQGESSEQWARLIKQSNASIAANNDGS
jgi:DNA-directed RNA polymerase specialized sigma24 family protein